MMNNKHVQQYIWYTSNLTPEGEERCHYHDGKWYSAYITDPEPNIIDKYDMRFVGVGDILFPQKHTNTPIQPLR